jgi:hypothetical protein
MLNSIIRNKHLTNVAFDVFYFLQSGMRLRTPLNWGNHPEGWSRLREALSTGNTEWGLLAAWGILEQESHNKFGSRLDGIYAKNIIQEKVGSRIKLSRTERGKLQATAKKRNLVAHGLEAEVSWSDVDIVLSSAYRLHRS